MKTAHSVEHRVPRERRRWPRYDLDSGLAVTMTADGMTWSCRLEEVSLGGARLRLDRQPPRNLEVRIEHPAAGSVYAARTWVAAGRMGVRFDHSSRALDLITHGLIHRGSPNAA